MGNDSHFSLIDGFEMMLVNAGTFKMGAEGDSGMDDYDPMAGRDEKPAHQVTLTLDYYIGVYPVTQKQWIELMGDNPSKHKETQYIKGDVLRPVENVSFIDVQGFISKLNEKTGKKFRLPTEAEWEYAARGGYESKGYRYSGGSDPNEVAWNGSNSGMSSTTKAVGTKKPNELGIYDMSGNVFEWVNDRDGAYTDKAQTDPAGPEQAGNAAYDIRITRGGYYSSTSTDCRVSCRKPQEVNVKKDSIGFRLALTSDTQSPRKQAAVPTAEAKQPEIKAIDPAIEGIKQEIMAHLSANFGPVAGSMMDGYSQNPASVNLFFWNTIKQGFGIKSASDAPAAIQPEIKTGDSSGGNPAIEEIKQEIKARLEATYGPANAAVTGMMMNTYINSPEAGKLEFWQKIRESVGGQAAPVDPRRKQKSGDWEFIEDGDTVTVIRYWGKAEQVDIPAEINGKPVTRIDESAMDRNDFLDTVTIPGSVTEIAYKAFDGSAFMRHITIPDSVVSIGERAFNGCNLLSVTLGKGLKTIGRWAFSENQLTELVIPDNVTSMDESAFSDNFISKLTIGTGLTVIPKRAFCNNRFRQAAIPLEIPGHITDVGERAFDLDRYSRVVIPDEKIAAFQSIAKKAFDDAKFVKASDYAKEKEETAKAQALAETARKAAKAVDEKSKVIDLSEDNPAPCGRGWTFADGVYTVHDWSNVTITGDNKKSGRRIVVPKGARKVNITLQDAAIVTDIPAVTIDEEKRSGKNFPLEFLSPVTLWLKGKNTISTSVEKRRYLGKDFTTAGICIACEDLTIAGTGSLELAGSIHSNSDRKNNRSLTIYGVKIDLFYGFIAADNITINGGHITMGKRQEKEFTAARIVGKNIVVNGGVVNVINNSNYLFAIQGEVITVNGGDITAIKDSWNYEGDPPMAPAIGGFRFIETPGISGGDTVSASIIINGGKVTATVDSNSIASAIGARAAVANDRDKKDEEKLAALTAETSLKLVMTGGTVNVSKLKGRGQAGFLSSQIILDEVTGGALFEGEKQIVKKPDISPPVAPPEFAPDIFEYVDERDGYTVIDGFEMMRVKAGTFIMGATEDQGWEVERNEKPAHQVTLTGDFYIGIYPVTQKQWVEITGKNPSKLQRNDFDLKTQIDWSAVLGAKPSRFAGNDFYPVECVSHINVRDFILALNKKTGKNFRLPTEAEWEYAARGGLLSKGFMYAGSNNIKEVAASLSPTTTKGCNELGLYDMSGSVGEWVNDYLGDYTEEPKTDPTGPDGPAKKQGGGISFGSNVVMSNKVVINSSSSSGDTPERVVRGSGRIASRNGKRETHKYDSIGFRLVLAVKNEE